MDVKAFRFKNIKGRVKDKKTETAMINSNYDLLKLEDNDLNFFVLRNERTIEKNQAITMSCQ